MQQDHNAAVHRAAGVTVVTVHDVMELEALLSSPAIRKTETMQRLREIIQVYREYGLGIIRVKIHDSRDSIPGISWCFHDEKADRL